MSSELPPGAIPWVPPPSSSPSRSSAPAPAPAGRFVRFGMGDFWVVFGAQLGAAVVVQVLYVLLTGNVEPEDIPDSAQFLVFLPAQIVGGFVALLLLARRGGRDLRRDVGLGVSPSDWWAVPLGMGLQIAVLLLSVPLFVILDADEESSQEVVETINRIRGVGVWVAIVLGVGVLQPLLEEIMFRGFLLHALLRRTTPGWAIAVSSAAFGVVHFTGIAPDLPGLVSVVMLCGLGAVLAVLTLRRRSLSTAILVHCGFNLAALGLSAAA